MKIKNVLKNRWFLWFMGIFIMFALIGCSNVDQAALKKQSVASAQESKNVAVTSDNSQTVNGQLKVHFIDVGQADSILLQQGNTSMLIDAGNNSDSETVKNYISSQGITKLNYVIGTHPHEDHIGGLDYVINAFQIGKIYMPKATATTKTFQDVVNAIKNKGMQASVPTPGESFKLGDATCTILAPNGTGYEDVNNYSIVVRVQFGSTSFLLTGDAEDVSEREMMNKGFDLSANVLKVGHHGSASSTTDDFVSKVDPQYAIISVGKNNEYGHPHKPTMEKLKSKGIKVFRTDENGTIVAVSDGKSISFNSNPGSYNYNGLGTSAASSSKQTSTTASSSSTPAPAPRQTSPSTTSNADRIVYYTPGGKSYHYDRNCSTLARSKTILSGKLSDVINLGKSDPCDKCVR